MKFKSFTEALTADRSKFAAANDNKKERPPRYRGTLPALRWLWDNHPDLAPALASALPRPPTNWFVDVEPSKQEIRPTVGELMSASHGPDGSGLPASVETDETGTRVTIGDLKFLDGRLVEWGATRKGRKLKPKDATRVGNEKSSARDPSAYIKAKSTTPSPMAASHYHRPFSGEAAISSMYDPLPGVDAARDLLRSLGVDGSVPASKLPMRPKVGEDAIAKGAGFLGGVSNPSGNSSSGAVMWEVPEVKKGEVAEIIEEVAARGDLKSIGFRLGYKDDGKAIRAGKAALIDAARFLVAANKNRKNNNDEGFCDAV